MRTFTARIRLAPVASSGIIGWPPRLLMGDLGGLVEATEP